MDILLTGSSSGIGRSITENLLAQGHSVCGLARSDQSEFAQKHAHGFSSHCVDVADWAAVETVANELAKAGRAFDAMVLCAGIQGEIGPAMQADPRKWSDTVRLNLDGTFFALRAFFGLLRPASGRAKVMVFSGGGSTKARENFSAYGAAKTAIVRLVETCAAEWGDQSIDINAIAPGAIPTRLTDEVIALGPEIAGTAEYDGALRLKSGGGHALERTQALVQWLLSPASDGVSGRLIAAQWDPWEKLTAHKTSLASSDIFTLRRILPEERGAKWDE